MYELGNELGKGGFSIVRQGKHRTTGEPVRNTYSSLVCLDNVHRFCLYFFFHAEGVFSYIFVYTSLKSPTPLRFVTFSYVTNYCSTTNTQFCCDQTQNRAPKSLNSHISHERLGCAVFQAAIKIISAGRFKGNARAQAAILAEIEAMRVSDSAFAATFAVALLPPRLLIFSSNYHIWAWGHRKACVSLCSLLIRRARHAYTFVPHLLE